MLVKREGAFTTIYTLFTGTRLSFSLERFSDDATVVLGRNFSTLKKSEDTSTLFQKLLNGYC